MPYPSHPSGEDVVIVLMPDLIFVRPFKVTRVGAVEQEKNPSDATLQEPEISAFMHI